VLRTAVAAQGVGTSRGVRCGSSLGCLMLYGGLSFAVDHHCLGFFPVRLLWLLLFSSVYSPTLVSEGGLASEGRVQAPRGRPQWGRPAQGSQGRAPLHAGCRGRHFTAGASTQWVRVTAAAH
jgi:hypothetical protein